eukprot:jgi/Phyca11/15465/fgenesh1_pg.PHYCAscaffold_13_\
MRLSQVLVIAAASLLFASDTIAVATSNQAKISKMAQSSPNQRLLRSNKYSVKEEDESEDSVDFGKRGFATNDEEDLEERSPLSNAIVAKLDDIAAVSEAKINALLAMRDAFISNNKKEKELARGMLMLANKS